MLSWMRKTVGGSQPGASSTLSALEEIFAPAAAKARLDLESRHERAIPNPSPGDRLLSDRLLVIKVPKTASEILVELPENRTNSPD
ncbi:MAG: hypothetical protein Q7L55_10590 [Actinomycetota bacterium]|nr:hypothetical protein [Actinomycetota bacterium]